MQDTHIDWITTCPSMSMLLSVDKEALQQVLVHFQTHFVKKDNVNTLASKISEVWNNAPSPGAGSALAKPAVASRSSVLKEAFTLGLTHGVKSVGKRAGKTVVLSDLSVSELVAEIDKAKAEVAKEEESEDSEDEEVEDQEEEGAEEEEQDDPDEVIYLAHL